MRRILDASDVSVSGLSDLQTQLLSLYPDGYPEVNVEGERLMALDGLQYEFTKWGPGGGHHIFGVYTDVLYFVLDIPDIPENRRVRWLMMPIDLGWSMFHARRNKTIARINRVYDRINETVRLSPCERHARGIDDIGTTFTRWDQWRYSYVCTLLPAERRVSEMRFRAKADHEALVTVLAIKRWRGATGAYPPDLQTLVAASYLPGLPTDPYNDGTLVYRRTQDDFLLYSVGADFVDDGGRSGVGDDGKPKAWPDNGDAVFWPLAAPVDD
jgi:hypothetical protein